MGKMKVRINPSSGEYELEGERKDVVALLNELNLAETRTSRAQEQEEVAEGQEEITGWPSPKEVESFIEQKNEFRHTIGEISEHFFGRRISAPSEEKSYDKLHGRVKRAQKKLEKKYDGKFNSRVVSERIKNGNKPYREFWFSKSEN